jgi:hypothetical protein
MNPENNSSVDNKLNKIRTPQEVVKRVQVLVGVFQAATGRRKEEIIQILKENHLWSEVTDLEKKFLETTDDDSKFISMQYSWRAEAVYILLWALNRFEMQELPKNEENLDQIREILKENDFLSKIDTKDVQFRSINEIYNILDKVYKIDWEIRDAYINKKEPPNDYHPSIIYEWHYALNWLTKPDEEWDYTTTDT